MSKRNKPKPITKKIFSQHTLFWFVLATFVASIVYVSFRITIAPITYSPGVLRIKSDYALMILQCTVGIVALLLPGLLERKFRLRIPSSMIIVYAIFLYCAIYLGEVRMFYRNVPHWDTLLHTFSGFALGALGFSIINLLNGSRKAAISLSPAFVALFAFCFAVTLGVVWEIFEFAIDYFFDLGMQKFKSGNGKPLIGQVALQDTMKDLIVDTLGALAISIIGYLSLKHNKGWIDSFRIKKIKDPAKNKTS